MKEELYGHTFVTDGLTGRNVSTGRSR